MDTLKKINFGAVEESKSERLERLTPGIHEVTIQSIELKKNKNDKEYIEVVFNNTLNTRTHIENLYMNTEKGMEINIGKLKHIISAIAGKDAAENSYSIQELDKLLKDKPFRLKLSGEENVDSGHLKVYANLPYNNFAENIKIPVENSGLSFDENNQYDMKRIAAEMKEAISGVKKEDAEDALKFFD